MNDEPGPPAVVIDTNLFVAAYWNRRSASADVLRACSDGRARLLYTSDMKRELFLILRNIRVNEAFRESVGALLEAGALVEPLSRVHAVEDDPDDDKFLECALAADADYIVTSDDHLLRIGSFGRTAIVKPSAMRRLIA